MATHLVWFRNDLRVADNSALHYACLDPQASVIALYIATPQQWQQHNMAPAQAYFIEQNVRLLQQKLSNLNIPLIYRQVNDFDNAAELVIELCQQFAVDTVFYNIQYEWNEIQRDKRVAEKVLTCGFDDAQLLAPGQVLNQQGEMYKVFTPFRQAFIKQFIRQPLQVYPVPAQRQLNSDVVDFAVKQAIEIDYPKQSTTLFPPGEEAAINRLRNFCRHIVSDYARQRDLPAVDGTSLLSAYLVVGVLSPRQCVARLMAEHPDFIHRPESGAFVWFSELVWREFYRHLLVSFPRLGKHKPFQLWTDQVVWRDDQAGLMAWQEGRTGFPIVDAAMRQLNQTGWMHNRLRMIVASFLVKDLLIDWRLGEQYFMSKLVDGDLAANNGGWQWAASTGTDAAPYFRIFNPTTQGKRFDPEGEFIRHWLPELARVSDPHQPKCLSGYPEPIVDHALARKRTLAAFERAALTKSHQ